MDVQEWVGLGGVPVVVALVQLVKPFVHDERFWPVIAVVFGVTWNMVVATTLGSSTAADLARAALFGVVVGLAASGLYSGGRTVLRQ
ncbi:MAG: hypothetical protein KatS3mg060_1151 [Dehalococcoidia bacterium]|nr:MAG: hypothetical protein KatS3mg060_1151 [Dehalococcoidia bacterium]